MCLNFWLHWNGGANFCLTQRNRLKLAQNRWKSLIESNFQNLHILHFFRVRDVSAVLGSVLGQKKILDLYHQFFQIRTLSKDILNETNAKIDVKTVRDFQSRSNNKGYMDSADTIAESIDILKLQQSSKRFTQSMFQRNA